MLFSFNKVTFPFLNHSVKVCHDNLNEKGASINDVRIFEVILKPPPPFVRILFTKPYLLKSEFPETPLSPKIRTSLMDAPLQLVADVAFIDILTDFYQKKIICLSNICYQIEVCCYFDSC